MQYILYWQLLSEKSLVGNQKAFDLTPEGF